MERRLSIPHLAFALALAALVLVLGSRDVFWSDFFAEAWPAYTGMREHGYGELLELTPAYAGFVTLIGGPLAWLGGGLETTFRLTAIPGVLALAGLAVALRPLDRRHALLGIALVAGAPTAWMALDIGHPEDVLAAAAAVGGILAAVRGHATLAGILVALAIVAKQTAILALLPMALALPRGKWRAVAIPVLVTGVVYGALMLLRPPGAHLAVGAEAFFHPWQVWWPLGSPSETAVSEGGLVGPAWLAPIPHPLIIGLAAPLSALWWWRTRADRTRVDALALFALLALERCMLDPWNNGYYHLPLVLALAAWETERRRPPVITLAVTAAIWLTFQTFELRTGMAPFLTYLAWTLPLAVFLVRMLYARPAASRAEASSAPAFA